MQNAYGQAYGLNYRITEPLGSEFHYGVSAGFLFATGTPEINPATDLDVRSSDLWLYSLPLTFSIVRALPISISNHHPYFGFGAGGQIGLEVLQAKVADLLLATTSHQTSFRSSWTGQIIFGLESGMEAHNPFLEIQWIIGGPSSDSDGLTGDERVEAEEMLYDAVSRPDGRFSGWKFSLGLRW